MASPKNDENKDENKQPIGIQSQFEPRKLEQMRITLQEYDKNKDGHISWQEFCDMAKKKQFSDPDRNKYWIQFGGKINDNTSKISLQHIIQSSPIATKQKREKFIRKRFDKKEEHTDDNEEEFCYAGTKLSSTPRATRLSEESLSNERSKQTKTRQEIEEETTKSTKKANKRSSSVPATPKKYKSCHFISEFNTNASAQKAYHSDEEPETAPQRIKRYPTQISDVNIQPKTLLMDEPLRLFDRYDIESNGKLNISQFVAMVTELYGTDHKTNDNESFHTKIRDTFIKIDKMNGSNGSFLYGENVHNLEAEIQKFGAIPTSDEFLSLCIDIFANFNENKNKNNDNKSSAELSSIEYVEKIMHDFAENIANKTKKKYQMSKMTVQELWDWIEDKAIPAIKQNEALHEENERVKSVNASIQNTIPTLEKELKLKEEYVSELEANLKSQDVQLSQDLLLAKRAYQDISHKYNALYEDYESLKEEFDKAKKANATLKQIDNKQQDIVALQTRCQSLENQNDTLHKIHHEKVARLEDEKQALIVRQQLTMYKHQNPNNLSPNVGLNEVSVSHGHGQSIPDSDTEEEAFDGGAGNSDDSHDGYGSHPRTRRNSNESVRFFTTLDDEFEMNERDTSKTQTATELYSDNDHDLMSQERIREEIKLQCQRELQMLLAQQTSDIVSDMNNSLLLNESNECKEVLVALNEENKRRDKEWREVVDALKCEFTRIVQELNGKLLDKQNEFGRYKQQQTESFEEIAGSIKETELRHQEILNKIKKETNEILLNVKCEENNATQLKVAKNKEIAALKQELMSYKNQQDIITYIRQNVVHKNDKNEEKEQQNEFEMLQKQIQTQIKQIGNELQNIQQCLAVESQICIDAIESTQDNINISQIQSEIENTTQFSSLGTSIYQIKAQLNDIFILMQDNNNEQHQNIDANEENKCESIDSEDSETRKYLRLKEKIDNEMDEIEHERQQKKLLEQEFKEEKDYQIEAQQTQQFIDKPQENEENVKLFLLLFEPEINKLCCKMDNLLRSNCTENDKICLQIASNHKLLLSESKNLNQFDMNNKIRINDLWHKISNIIKKELEHHRTLIALEISQNIKYIAHNNNNNGFSDRQDEAIKSYIAKVDAANTSKMGKKWKELEEKMTKYQQDANVFWSTKMETNINRSLEHKFANMSHEISTEIAKLSKYRDEDLESESKEEEYTTLQPSPSPSASSASSASDVDQFALIETRMVDKIKSNKPSYGCILLMALIANAVFFMAWSTHKGYYYDRGY